MAAVAEQLSKLADEMARVADVLRANRSRTPAHPHLSGVERSAGLVSLTLRSVLANSDDAMHLAGEIDSWRDTWRERCYMPPSADADWRLAEGMGYASRFVEAKAQELRS
jgi:hypothetical protein